MLVPLVAYIDDYSWPYQLINLPYDPIRSVGQ